MRSTDAYPHLFAPRMYRSETYINDKTVEIEITVTPIRPDYSSESVKKRAEEITLDIK